MANRNTPTAASAKASEALVMLEGDFEDAAESAVSKDIETSRGTWTVWTGPVSLKVLDQVQRLLSGPEDEQVPLEAMADVLILLARTEDQALMFRKPHRARLLEKVNPLHIIEAATFLAAEATDALADAEEEAGKD